ncbi:unnamed protein product [Didymodactylos carnosus]|uniref:Uncharacterized protein n=1 Tax=Didymodactylos carnosus TaxID=1234261 RepID=A0A814Q169_9BILA|nr:unnamed protein product [Didymodactylos carnosus]CAF1113870.1 unnamed protein product [Didymodactylos carnosus]CAF3836856.1 unnamed protein product [Didymodactylos carnosus]CAF3877982.1 unnamed protein product [Didymodactylos carnosus]
MISYHSAQTEWNAIKKDDDVVQEKIEEYLEIYNRSGAAGLALEEAAPKRKKTTKTTTKSKKKRKHSSSSDNDDEAVTAKEIVTTT